MSSCCSVHVGPSLLACDLAQIGAESARMLAAGADFLHLDVMDGHFVPNITWGPPVVASLRQALGPSARFDCHMMVTNPAQWIEPIAKAAGTVNTQYTFHLEAATDPVALVALIRAAGLMVGVAIKPGTPAEAVLPLVPLVDMVLVMTVEPGFGGQSFMPHMMPKVALLRNRFPVLNIEVDGGLGPDNVELAAASGANMIVAGSAVFRASDARAVIGVLRRAVEGAITVHHDSDGPPAPGRPDQPMLSSDRS